MRLIAVEHELLLFMIMEIMEPASPNGEPSFMATA
jgi:hypothetical protein